MIYPVRISGKSGKEKKIISTRQWTTVYWGKIYKGEEQIDLMYGPRINTISRHSRDIINVKVAGFRDSSFSSIN